MPFFRYIIIYKVVHIILIKLNYQVLFFVSKISLNSSYKFIEYKKILLEKKGLRKLFKKNFIVKIIVLIDTN